LRAGLEVSARPRAIFAGSRYKLTVTNRHYDVIVLGRSLGALACAAILARRDFRVLLLGQGQKSQLYRYDQRVLARRPFTFLSGSSPVFRRILHELAQSQQFRRRMTALDPMFGWLSPGRRLEVPPDMELFVREIEREFPEVRQLVDELYTTIAQVNAVADLAFEKEAVWPPGTLWERFETGRIAASLPYTKAERNADLLSKFPSGHPFRDLLILPAMFATHLALPGDRLPPLCLARLHGVWTRGISALVQSERELCDFLIERIEAHGGAVAMDRRATSIVVRRGSAVGVIEDGEGEATGCTAVVCDQSGEAVAELASGEGVSKQARDDWPQLRAEASRFVVSLRVQSAGLPDSLPAESFVVPERYARRDPRAPALRLSRLSPQALDEDDADPSSTLLVAEALLPARGALTLLEARDAVLGTLREHLPFLERALSLVDSVHDGLPLWDFRSGNRREVERAHLHGAAAGSEPMERLWTCEPTGYLELSGEPVRGPIPGTYLVGKTVLPGLGQEGELVAAASAAHVITGKDGRRQRMRRQMWSKIETT
jgi:phytoene dehydrogenase-like protein